jgi:2'-hydroxyisoflavone reductase
MRLLVLGGTSFLGRAAVESALTRGHDVTIFHRGETNDELFPEVEHLHGDRDGGLEPLRDRTWDAVVDTSGYVPRVVRASAELLRDAVELYVFVSSVSVYAEISRPLDEDAPLAELSDPATEDVGEHYGALKAACERVVLDVFDARAAIVRPGLIVGPHDPTARVTYWPLRLARGGDVLAPGDPERAVQIVDVRDLGDWLVKLAEDRRGGVFNAVGPDRLLTMRETLESCRRIANDDATLVWVDNDFLLEHEVGEWMELPLWLADPKYAGMTAVANARAIGAGLRFRPIDETVRDTLAWAQVHPDDVRREEPGRERPPAGMAPEREAELLEAWRTR